MILQRLNLNLQRLSIHMDDLYSELVKFKTIYEKLSKEKYFIEMSTG